MPSWLRAYVCPQASAILVKGEFCPYIVSLPLWLTGSLTIVMRTEWDGTGARTAHQYLLCNLGFGTYNADCSLLFCTFPPEEAGLWLRRYAWGFPFPPLPSTWDLHTGFIAIPFHSTDWWQYQFMLSLLDLSWFKQIRVLVWYFSANILLPFTAFISPLLLDFPFCFVHLILFWALVHTD